MQFTWSGSMLRRDPVHVFWEGIPYVYVKRIFSSSLTSVA